MRRWLNKQRRVRLSEAHSLLGKAASIVEAVKDEEQDSFDNLPEGLQCSERGEAMEEAVDELQMTIDSIEDALGHIDNAVK